MAKSPGQKLKLLHMMDYFLHYSDEQHPVTVKDIIDHLAALDIKAERKSIYDDIEALKHYGLDIVMVRDKTVGYYVASRKYELAELKLLVDSVQSSKFITHKKTLALIKKLENELSVYEAGQLQRQVYVSGRIKRDNESVYYNVDAIHNAISANRKISFKYFDYTVKKEKLYRKSGERYIVSPIGLLWDDENYYLVAYEDASGIVKHFRCDKMTSIEPMQEKHVGKETYGNLDMGVYSKKVFGMFSGRERKVHLRFDNRLAGAAIDRFGRDVIIIEDGQGCFTVTVDVNVSPQFFGWLLGLGTGVEIIGPADVVDEMRDYISAIHEKYSGG